MLGIKDKFLPRVAQIAIDLSPGCDEDVLRNADKILSEVAKEEERCAAP